MSNSIHHGDNIFGKKILLGDSIVVHQGIGKVENRGSGNVVGVSAAESREAQVSIDLQSILNGLSDAVLLLRRQLAERDRVLLDDSVRLINDRGDEPGAARRAFYSIAGLAAVVSGVGTPIVEAIRQIVGAINS